MPRVRKENRRQLYLDQNGSCETNRFLFEVTVPNLIIATTFALLLALFFDCFIAPPFTN